MPPTQRLFGPAFILVIVVLYAQSASQAADEYDVVGRPSNLALQRPASSVPAECATFFSEVGWGKGRWEGVGDRAIELWVEWIDKSCTARVVYSWGTSRKRGGNPSFRRVTAKIADGALTIPKLRVGRIKAKVTYTLSGDGSALMGVFQPADASKSRVILVRGSHFPANRDGCVAQ